MKFVFMNVEYLLTSAVQSREIIIVIMYHMDTLVTEHTVLPAWQGAGV